MPCEPPFASLASASYSYPPTTLTVPFPASHPRLSYIQQVIYNKQMEPSQAVREAMKIVVVGDDLVGKSCAIAKFSSAEDPYRRSWTVFECIKASVEVAGKSVPVEIWDLTGKREYKAMIQSLIEGADIVLIFFSVVDVNTYTSALQQWYPQISAANPKALKVFVGNKIDLRPNAASTGSKVVEQKQAKAQIEQQLKCKYLECNALTGEGVKHVFEFGVRTQLGDLGGQVQAAGRQHLRNKDSQCCALI